MLGNDFETSRTYPLLQKYFVHDPNRVLEILSVNSTMNLLASFLLVHLSYDFVILR